MSTTCGRYRLKPGVLTTVRRWPTPELVWGYWTLSGRTPPGRRPAAPPGRGAGMTAPAGLAAPAVPAALADLDEAALRTGAAATTGGRTTPPTRPAGTGRPTRSTLAISTAEGGAPPGRRGGRGRYY